MSRIRSVGLAVLVVLGVLDLAGLAGFFMADAPPAWVLVVGGLLGVATLVGAGLAYAGRPGGIATAVVSRIVSAVLGLGAFTDSSAPGWARTVVLISIVLTVVGVGLVVAGRPAVARTQA